VPPPLQYVPGATATTATFGGLPPAIWGGPIEGMSITWLNEPDTWRSNSHDWVVPVPFLVQRGSKGNNAPFLAAWFGLLEQYLKDTGVDLAHTVLGPLGSGLGQPQRALLLHSATTHV
jgi:hypothetical protein